MKIFQVSRHARMDRMYYFYVQNANGESTILNGAGKPSEGFIIERAGTVYYDKLVFSV